MRLCEQSLSIYHDICDSKGQATSLNNISQIYKAQGEYVKTLKYLEQSLSIFQVFRDKEGEGATLNNIAMLFYANGDYHNALYYLEQSLMIAQNETCKNGEGVTLDNIGKIYYYQGNYTEALQYYKQALAVSREIKNRITESKVLNNIGQVYSAKKNYEVALEYSKQALVITKEIGIKAEEVRQVRLAPINVQNVITYNVVVAVDNQDLRLKPGMTANVAIVVAQKDQVLKVPNAALRFTPPKGGGAEGSASEGRPSKAEGRPSGSRPASGGAEVSGAARKVWKQDESGELVAIPIQPGISDGVATEIVGDALAENDVVIVGLDMPRGNRAGSELPPGFGSGGQRRTRDRGL